MKSVWLFFWYCFLAFLAAYLLCAHIGPVIALIIVALLEVVGII